MTLLNDPAFTFIMGWASCVLFIAAWEWIGAAIEQSRPNSVSDRHRDSCPWPSDDEAAVRLAEYHPVHSRGDKA